ALRDAGSRVASPSPTCLYPLDISAPSSHCPGNGVTRNDKVQLAEAETRETLLGRANLLMGSEPNFARFLAATVSAADPEDFAGVDAAAFEAQLRLSCERLGRRAPGSHLLDFHPSAGAGQPDVVDVYSAD